MSVLPKLWTRIGGTWGLTYRTDDRNKRNTRSVCMAIKINICVFFVFEINCPPRKSASSTSIKTGKIRYPQNDPVMGKVSAGVVKRGEGVVETQSSSGKVPASQSWSNKDKKRLEKSPINTTESAMQKYAWLESDKRVTRLFQHSNHHSFS